MQAAAAEFARKMVVRLKGTGFSVMGTGFSVKGTGFSVMGTGFSVKGTGFIPYIHAADSSWALAPDGMQWIQRPFPQGLKPNVFSQRLAARLKPCPFKATTLFGLSGFMAVRTAVIFLPLAATLIASSTLRAQSAPASGPIAIVPLNNKNPDAAATVTGALEVSQGKAVIAASGTVTSGSQTTEVALPRRGTLRVCATTTVKLAADTSVPAGETPGLMMAMDHGAVEMSFAASVARGRNADILMTPDFRILIGGVGAADVKVRLGQHGDTCVENGKTADGNASSLGPNAATDAPYVLVTGIFDSGDYRVQSGQRVMFQHGSLHEVVDNEKEPCGCPPTEPKGNEFPLAQSEGLAPLPQSAPSAVNPAANASVSSVPIEPLVYKSPVPLPVAEAASAAAITQPAKPPAKKKQGFFGGIGKFFRRLFGAE